MPTSGYMRSQKHESSLGIETLFIMVTFIVKFVPKSMNPLWGLKPIQGDEALRFERWVPKSMNPLWGLKLPALQTGTHRDEFPKA